MSIGDIDKILAELSIKFNRIFYDRDFICSVLEDFRVVLENKNKSCVVVIFPALGPNYLKAIQYQAELFDLATFTLGSRKLLCVGVCFKGYITRNVQSYDSIQTSNKMPETEAKCSVRVRKKRPERQLYIPPAQRILQRKHLDTEQTFNDGDQKQRKGTVERKDSKKTFANIDVAKAKILEAESKSNKENSSFQRDYFSNDFVDYFLWYYTFSLQWKYRVPEKKSSFLRDTSVMKAYIFFKTFTKVFDNCLYRIPLYFCCPIARLEILRRDIFLWQPKSYYFVNSNCKITNFPKKFSYMEMTTNEPIPDIRIPVTVDNCSMKAKNELKYDFHDYVAAESEICGLFVSEYYFFAEDNTFDDFNEEILDHILGPEERHESENGNSATLQAEVHMISDDPEISVVDTSQVEENSGEIENCKSAIIQETTEFSITSNNDDTQVENVIKTTLELDVASQSNEVLRESEIMDSVVSPALSSRSNVAVGENASMLDGPSQSESAKYKLTQTAPEVLVISDIECEVSSTKTAIHSRLDEALKERTEHDEEKEIMRRTKENINRRIKPIMKYVEDADNTLCISKGDNINNWEDLFDDEGQLHEGLVKEIVKKVGKEVTIVKAKEDYTDYCSIKPIEEFEHMVELYDFPSTFDTNDLIQAFSEIQSDAMYVKWVDDTHAILVLGSLAQAQKAVSLTSPIIKARLMTAASRATLNTAQRHDLKPAMKRPQTNLQTARRLITTHLGKKSAISQEKSAQEKNDLKAARDKKRIVKKNEQDAWEGKLRSSLN